MAQIFVFGDSIAFGYVDAEGGWVQRLRRKFDQEAIQKGAAGTSVHNLGVSGDTSRHILERFEREITVRLWPEEEATIVFAVGTNDAGFWLDKDANWISTKEYEDNLAALLEVAGKFSENILFIGPPPVVDNLTNPVPWDKNLCYRDSDVKSYSAILAEFCRLKKRNFLDLRTHWSLTNPTSLLYDGLHPNSQGHQLIFEIVSESLSKM